MEKNKRLFTEFIDIYRDNQCLWNPKHPSYKNQIDKQDAYEKLLKVMKKFDPTNKENTIETVKRKINSMRASFRRDYRKVRESNNTYKPNLWYYEQLLFVKNYEMKYPFDPKDMRDDDDIGITDFTYLEMAEDEVTDSQNTPDDEEMFEVKEIHEIEEHIDDSYYSQDDETQVTIEDVEGTQSPEGEEKTIEKEDECSTFGKHIAFELQLMSERQRIIAKKLLSDIAFYGRLERLTEYTEITSTKKPDT